MPQVARADGWVRYTHHRQAAIAEWDAGLTLKRTAEPEEDSQYNPHLFGTDQAVMRIELLCVETGTQIRDSGNRETKYLRLPGVIVGVCSGEYTEYVFAECTSGFYHGRPISAAALRRLGVEVHD